MSNGKIDLKGPAALSLQDAMTCVGVLFSRNVYTAVNLYVGADQRQTVEAALRRQYGEHPGVEFFDITDTAESLDIPKVAKAHVAAVRIIAPHHRPNDLRMSIFFDDGARHDHNGLRYAQLRMVHLEVRG